MRLAWISHGFSNCTALCVCVCLCVLCAGVNVCMDMERFSNRKSVFKNTSMVKRKRNNVLHGPIQSAPLSN